MFRNMTNLTMQPVNSDGWLLKDGSETPSNHFSIMHYLGIEKKQNGGAANETALRRNACKSDVASGDQDDFIIGPDDPILITGAGGFIGIRLVGFLLEHGFRKLRCFIRSTKSAQKIQELAMRYGQDRQCEIVHGNLLSREDCMAAMANASVVFHLAAGRGEKSFPDAFVNSVVTTRNLLEARVEPSSLRRFVNISSFAVYSNEQSSRWLDEESPVENHPELRGDAYAFGKVKQDEILMEYGQKCNIPYVIVRPGYVYGPGKTAITGRVGIDSFGIFLHLGGSNEIPFTYIDNCVEAIALAGLKKGVNGEIFNVVDDDLPTSRRFLRLYKKNVRDFRSLYLPAPVSYFLCYLWERYSNYSQGQLPLAFNRKRWRSNWRKTHYSNNKLKTMVGWTPKVPMAVGLDHYFRYCRETERND
jgi:nucleoside-diphosphate-sugar epimerase